MENSVIMRPGLPKLDIWSETAADNQHNHYATAAGSLSKNCKLLYTVRNKNSSGDKKTCFLRCSMTKSATTKHNSQFPVDKISNLDHFFGLCDSSFNETEV